MNTIQEIIKIVAAIFALVVAYMSSDSVGADKKEGVLAILKEVLESENGIYVKQEWLRGALISVAPWIVDLAVSFVKKNLGKS